MRRYRSVVVVLAFVVGGIALFTTNRARAHAQTRTLSPTQTLSRSLSETALAEYGTLLKTAASDAEVRTWASRNNLRIVSMTRNRLVLEPDLPTATIDPTTTALQVCDPSRCAGTDTIEGITNTQGVVTTLKTTSCRAIHAASCKFVPDPSRPGSWIRICDYRNCYVSYQKL